MIEPQMAEQLQQSIVELAQKLEAEGKPVVILVQSALRNMLARFSRGLWDGLNVLAFDEVPENKKIIVVSTIGR
jgi:flagellar biosynthesis protein FlhA